MPPRVATAEGLATISGKINALEQQLESLRSDHASLAAAARDVGAEQWDSASTCSFPPSANFTLWHGNDVKLPVPWCGARERPAAASSKSLATLARECGAALEQPEARRPAHCRGESPTIVLPSLLVPCCAHSGTTFLWRCMQYSFHPEKVCGRLSRSPGNPGYAGHVNDWTRAACGSRRYLLPGLTGNIQGHWDYRKEWFFYGGGAASWSKGWADYTGIELPLCYWEREFQRRLRERPIDDTLANSRRLCMSHEPHEPQPDVAAGDEAQGGKWRGGGRGRARKLVRRSRERGPACMHRACLALDLDKVKLGPKYRDDYDRRLKPRWQWQATKALPRVDPTSHAGVTVSDMTPNYLCSPRALRNLASSLGTPAHFRMLVLTRRPLEMIIASYKMFVEWNWVRTADLSSDVRTQLAGLKKCNATLYHQPQTLADLPAAELLHYFGSCWRGIWRDFVANSLPYVCIRAWLAAGFRKEQFLVVRSERLRTASALGLVAAVANFTGLHMNGAVLLDKKAELEAHCEAPDAASKRAAAAAAAGRASSPAAAAQPGERPFVNSHSSYAGKDAVRRTRLEPALLTELTRLADAHLRLLDSLGLRELEL